MPQALNLNFARQLLTVGNLFQITRWLLPLWTMAAVFDTENNEFSQDDYVVPVIAVNDDSGVSYRFNHIIIITVEPRLSRLVGTRKKK